MVRFPARLGPLVAAFLLLGLLALAVHVHDGFAQGHSCRLCQSTSGVQPAEPIAFAAAVSTGERAVLAGERTRLAYDPAAQLHRRGPPASFR